MEAWYKICSNSHSLERDTTNSVVYCIIVVGCIHAGNGTVFMENVGLVWEQLLHCGGVHRHLAFHHTFSSGTIPWALICAVIRLANTTFSHELKLASGRHMA